MELKRTQSVLQAGIDDGTQVGAQLAVSLEGELGELALGIAAPGVPMRADTMMIWFSMSKATCAVAVAQQWERGSLRLDEPAATYLPAFAANGKAAITVRHLLTHTAGIPWADGLFKSWPWRESEAENIERICAAPVEQGWRIGEDAGYHPGSGMAILAAIVVAIDGREYSRYVREMIFEPLGMNDSWVGMPQDRFVAYGDRIGVMHNTKVSPPEPLRLDQAHFAKKVIAGGNGRGPMRDLVRLYEMLVNEGTREGVQLLQPVTVAAISAKHRTEVHDRTFGAVLNWGLGFGVDGYAMGRHCSRRAFGHGGMESSAGFCDPEHGLAVTVVCNGMPGGERHHPRMDAIATAIYEDLGLAHGEGRDHNYPSAGI